MRGLRRAAVLAVLLAAAGCTSAATTLPTFSSTPTATTTTTKPPAATTKAVAPACPATGGGVGNAGDVLQATLAFLSVLDKKQAAAVKAARTRANLAQWSDLPDSRFRRAGLRLDTLSDAQRAHVMAILAAALSPSGYAQVQGITVADDVLAARDGAEPGSGALHYWVRVLGDPAPAGKWTLQYGGHHLALNITVSGDETTLAPALWGARPAFYESAGTKAEPLCGEVVKAFALVNALDATQRDQALLDVPVQEIVLGPGQDNKAPPGEGVGTSTFTEAQKTLLLDLLTEWISPLNTADAAAKLETARAEADRFTFAWSGETTAGSPVYYRLAGPSFTVELAHQRADGGTSHIHAVYREPGNDYGARLPP